jgi:hypothetical protein
MTSIPVERVRYIDEFGFQAAYFSPKYNDRWAIIVGINNYQTASNLFYASNDAKSIAEILTDKFNFPGENVSLLLDDKATKSAMSTFGRNSPVGFRPSAHPLFGQSAQSSKLAKATIDHDTIVTNLLSTK